MKAKTEDIYRRILEMSRQVTISYLREMKITGLSEPLKYHWKWLSKFMTSIFLLTGIETVIIIYNFTYFENVFSCHFLLIDCEYTWHIHFHKYNRWTFVSLFSWVFFLTSCHYSPLLKTAETKDFHLLTMYSDHDNLLIPANNRSTLTIRGAESNNGALFSLQKATARDIYCVILSIITVITKSYTAWHGNKRILFIRIQDFGTHNIKKKTVLPSRDRP